MTIFKCKMCGGTLEFTEGASVATCEYCGTKQTLPRLNDDRKKNLYDRANHFRRNNEFDKAMGIYEMILNEDETDAEAYWSLVLCRYGVEYVEDPTSRRRIPTVNRAQYTPVSVDPNYQKALSHADVQQKEIYEQEANAIDEIQKGILAISQKEEPFDVFICYKETDELGQRTHDSVLANEIYDKLEQNGLKVFFAKITLEDKLGTAYEPYIFAALHSAKVMVVVGTKKEHLEAVWVKNEWSRYLTMIRDGEDKTLVPVYRDMDPYDLPEAFSHLQAQDMSKVGAIQDLVRGVKKVVDVTEDSKSKAIVSGVADLDLMWTRVQALLEEKKWDLADQCCERMLDADMKSAKAYLGKLFAELHISKIEELEEVDQIFENKENYQKVVEYADTGLKEQLLVWKQNWYEAYTQKKKAKNKKIKIIMMIIVALCGTFICGYAIFFYANNTLIPKWKMDELIDVAKDYAQVGNYDGMIASWNTVKTYENVHDTSYTTADLELVYTELKKLYVESMTRKVNELFEEKKYVEILDVYEEYIEHQWFFVDYVSDENEQYVLMRIKLLEAISEIYFEALSEDMYESMSECIRQYNLYAGWLLSSTTESTKVMELKAIMVQKTIDNLVNTVDGYISQHDYKSAYKYYSQIDNLLSKMECPDKYGFVAEKIQEAEKYDFIKPLQESSVGQVFKMGREGTWEWIVVAKEDGKALLCSKECVNQGVFSLNILKNWSDSILRQWLNETFYKTFFKDYEINCILETKHDAVLDYVFIPSIEEYEKYIKNNNSLKLETSWWLRDSETTTNNQYYVTAEDKIEKKPRGWEDGVRPMIWVQYE